MQLIPTDRYVSYITSGQNGAKHSNERILTCHRGTRLLFYFSRDSFILSLFMMIIMIMSVMHSAGGKKTVELGASVLLVEPWVWSSASSCRLTDVWKRHWLLNSVRSSSLSISFSDFGSQNENHVMLHQLIKVPLLCVFFFFFSSLLSEFLAEESQETFWDFVEANQNIEGEHDGNVKPLQTPDFTFSLCAASGWIYDAHAASWL